MIVRDRPDMSVAVTSFNRRDLLMEGLAVLDRQSLRLQVIVADDGSTDGSVQAVEARWPEVTLLANESGRSNGVARQLRLAYERAVCRHLASFDEDFHLRDADALERLLRYFDDPRVAVVAIPFRDVLVGENLQQTAPSALGTWQRYTFTGNGYLIDLDRYRTVGGYYDWYQSYRQEEDLAMRFLARDWIVRVIPSGIEGDHYRRPGQLGATARFRSARNDLLFYWQYAPCLYLVPYLWLTILRNLADGRREADVLTRLKGLLGAPAHGYRNRVHRQPVSTRAFLRYRKIKRAGILRADAVVGPHLPAAPLAPSRS